MNKANESTSQPKQVNDRDERMWAMLCHIITYSGFFFPLANIIAPLIIWLLKKEEFPLVDDQGKEAINFQITMTILYIASGILCIIIIGIPILIGLIIFDFIVTIIAAIKANDGEKYRYPFNFRFIS